MIQVISKKYSPIGELSEFASTYAETLANTFGAKLEYSGDMGIPPLPNQVLPSEKEVNSNSKI